MSKTKLCEECKAPMEYLGAHEERLNDGHIHLLDEFVCRSCGNVEKVDLGPVVPER